MLMTLFHVNDALSAISAHPMVLDKLTSYVFKTIAEYFCTKNPSTKSILVSVVFDHSIFQFLYSYKYIYIYIYIYI